VLEYLKDYFPDVSDIDKIYSTTLDRVFDRMPRDRIRMIASKAIAKDIVLNLGTDVVSELAKQVNVNKMIVISQYLKVSREMKVNGKIKEIINNEEKLRPIEQIARLKALRDNLKSELYEALVRAKTRPEEEPVKITPDQKTAKTAEVQEPAQAVNEISRQAALAQMKAGPMANMSDLQNILKLIPAKWLEGCLDLDAVSKIIKEAGCAQDMVSDDGKLVLIFSEKATFGEHLRDKDKKDEDKYEEGLGVLLPNFIKSGVKVAVIAPTDKQKKLIDELNEGKSDEHKIIYADNVSEVTAKVCAARYYYFKTETEPDAGVNGVTNINIIVKKIIDAIGKVVDITESKVIEQMHEAALQFAMAA